MADLLIEFRDAKGVDLHRQTALLGFGDHFFTSRLVDMPAEQHNIIFSYIAPDEMDAPTIVITDIKRKALSVSGFIYCDHDHLWRAFTLPGSARSSRRHLYS